MLNREFPYDPTVLLLGIFPREMKPYVLISSGCYIISYYKLSCLQLIFSLLFLEAKSLNSVSLD